MLLKTISTPTSEFEKLYLQVREKEGRLYDLAAVRQLPDVSNTDPHRKEWQIRKVGLKSFLQYLGGREDVQSILEVGCGNGWFGAAIAKEFPDRQVTGCDLNLYELQQAEKAFQQDNLTFLYADIFKDWPRAFAHFDLVVLPSSAQYFPDLDELIDSLWGFTGEIHIIDTPFYSNADVAAARQRSRDYYRQLGFPDMANSYFHHSYEALTKHGHQFFYRPPAGWRRRFSKNPFPWIRLVKA